jgi:hypothetical protein
LIHRAAHDLFGYYDETYRIAADTKFLMTARRAGAAAEFEEHVGVFATGGASADYLSTVKEHARAMLESGSWSPLRSLTWSIPRQVLGHLRHRSTAFFY